MAIKLTDAVIRRMTVNFTDEQRDFAEQNFGVRDWPEQFLRHMVDARQSDTTPPSTETWDQTMRAILGQIRARQMNA